MSRSDSTPHDDVSLVVRELATVRERGIPNVDTAQISALTGMATDMHPSERPTVALESMLRAAAARFGQAHARDEVEAAFGLTEGTLFWPAKRRRAKAAEIHDPEMSVETYRHGPEATMKRQLAEYIVDNWSKSHTGSRSSASVAPENPLQSLLGVAEVFVPLKGSEDEANRERNARKLDAIRRSAETSTLRLVAQSGYSFLSPRGIYFKAIESHLENGGGFHIVLSLPRAEMTVLSESELHARQAKLKQAEIGFFDLCRRYGSRIAAHVYPSSLPATILLTDTMCFFEPYIHSDTLDRERLLFVTFELAMDRTVATYGYDLLSDHFQSLYARGAEIDSPEVWNEPTRGT